MVANMAATPSGKFGSSWKTWLGAIDGGAVFHDKRPVLGKGKTWAGLLGGVLAAGLFALIVAPCFGAGWSTPFWLLLGLALGLGALCGDLVKSFFKRRLNFPNDSCLPILDQLDFLVGAAAVYALFTISEARGFLDQLPWKLTPPGFLCVCVVMLVLHPTINLVAYKLSWKRVPF
ncbi:CDP-2,3-bis-(O-geranylgeranyl)-sn-glycerol synthase [soil metagenome]